MRHYPMALHSNIRLVQVPCRNRFYNRILSALIPWYMFLLKSFDSLFGAITFRFSLLDSFHCQILIGFLPRRLESRRRIRFNLVVASRWCSPVTCRRSFTCFMFYYPFSNVCILEYLSTILWLIIDTIWQFIIGQRRNALRRIQHRSTIFNDLLGKVQICIQILEHIHILRHLNFIQIEFQLFLLFFGQFLSSLRTFRTWMKLLDYRLAKWFGNPNS